MRAYKADHASTFVWNIRAQKASANPVVLCLLNDNDL